MSKDGGVSNVPHAESKMELSLAHVVTLLADINTRSTCRPRVSNRFNAKV
jgi:hypothetical protein